MSGAALGLMDNPEASDAARNPHCTWLYVTALAVLAVDQLTKAAIVHGYAVGESVGVVEPVLYFTRRINTGGAFGILSGNAHWLAVVSAGVIVAMLLLGPRLAGGVGSLGGMGLVVGGAGGNLIDRLRLGHVIDFIDFRVWPVFNVADSAVTIGAFLILLAVVREATSARARGR